MPTLTDIELTEMGIPPFEASAVATARARSILNYIVMFVALGRDRGLSFSEIADWIHECYAERGYYDSWLLVHGEDRLKAFLQTFLLGRRLLYDQSTVKRLADGSYEVITPTWYQRELPQTFFYFAIEPEDLREYVSILARSNAQRLGIEIEIEHQDHLERAIIREAAVPNLSVNPAATSKGSGQKMPWQIRQKSESDRHWLPQFLNENWGGTVMVSRRTSHNLLALPALIAESDGKPCGIAIYHPENSECELLALNAFPPGQGIGTALLKSLLHLAKQQRWQRLWLITTNDNLAALRFYQRRGFRLVQIDRDAVTAARKLKPSIPEIGYDGIAIQDELELELIVD